MRAGKLDRRITIEAKATTRGLSGEVVESWSPIAVVWAGRRDVRAGERFAADQTIAEVDTVFTVRFAPALVDLRPDLHRVRCEGQTFALHGVAQIGRRVGLELACAARAESALWT